jgi:ABC-type branched-subunit amino acid transport system permease subunit
LDFVLFVGFIVFIGLLLSLSALFVYQTSGRLFLAAGAVASASGYVFGVSANAGFSGLEAAVLSFVSGAVLSSILIALGNWLSAEGFLLFNLAFAELVRRVEFVFLETTGGPDGLQLDLDLGLSPVERGIPLAILALGLAVLAQWWLRSPKGLEWRTAGGARPAAISLGVNVLVVDAWGGLVAGVLAAVVGMSYVLSMRFIHPDDLGSSFYLSAVAIGLSVRPRKTVLDVAALAVLLFGSREALRLVDIGGTRRFGAFDVILGVVILLIARRLRGARGVG